MLIGVLARMEPFLLTQLFHMTYMVLIRMQLEYGSAAAVENKISSRIILGAPRNAHLAPLQKILGLDSLQSRRQEHMAQLVKTCMSELGNPAIRGMFVQQPNGRAVNLLRANY